MGADPFGYLVNCFVRERDKAEKRKLALELLPYVKPKLKAVSHDLGGSVVFEVSFGDEP